MLISSQPVLSSLEYGTELSPGQDSPPTAQPVSADSSRPESTIEMGDKGEALPNGEMSLLAPDLIHKNQNRQEESKLKATECRKPSSPSPSERNGLKLSLSPISLTESWGNSSPPTQARTSSLDNEGLHPDLLSFE